MKQQFIKVKIYSDRGYVQGCIDAYKVFAFRESPFDCNITIVYTEDKIFNVKMKFNEFCEKIGVI